MIDNNYSAVIKELFKYSNNYYNLCRSEYGDGASYTKDAILEMVLKESGLNNQQKELLKDIIDE